MFDYGMICSSEESIIVEASVKEELVQKLKDKGAYFIDEVEQDKLSQVLLNEKGTLNPQVVGKPVPVLAQLADIDVPKDAKLLIAAQTNISKENPFAGEKLTSLLTLYTVNDWAEGIEKASQLLDITGLGHTAIVYSTDQEKIEEFGVAVNASRIIVNSGGILGGIGMTTQLDPSLTLGCGTAGGGSTTDNITVKHLLNIRRVATHYER